MADGVFPSLVSKDRDVNAITNPIYTQLTNGTAVVGVTGGALDVNVDNTTIAVTQSGTWDIGTVGTITNVVSVDDNGGSLTVDGTVDVGTVSGTVTVTGTVSATQSGVWDIGTVTTLTGITNDVNIADGGNSITVDAVDLDIRPLTLAEDAVKISANATANGAGNPIYVSVVEGGASTTEVQDYATATPASGATANHDYTVTGTTMLVRSVIVSASGNCKFEIQGGPLASLSTYAVGFLTGREGDTKQVNFSPAIEVPVTSTGTVRVAITNRQNQSMDVYSTIIGDDV